jgi:hypothetical protein
MAPSIACHVHSRPTRSSYSSKAIAHSRANTPRLTSAWKYRCSELPDPNARGTAFHWQPVRRT